MKRHKTQGHKDTRHTTHDAKTEEVLCAGFGGQGIMFMGKILAHAALLEGKNVTWMPSYGAEVRGGTAHSMTKISTEYIANPVVTKPTTCIAMNSPSLVKYEGLVTAGGLLIVNRSLIERAPTRKDIDIITIPMTGIASSLGAIRVANMVGLGAYIKRKRTLAKQTIIAALREAMGGKEELLALNRQAFEKGYALARG